MSDDLIIRLYRAAMRSDIEVVGDIMREAARRLASIEAETVERCAKIVECFRNETYFGLDSIAAAIRKVPT